MPPNNTENVIMNEEKGEYPELNFLEVSGFASKTKNDESKTKESKRQPIIWTNVILISLFHVTAVYMFFAYVYYIKLITITWGKDYKTL